MRRTTALVVALLVPGAISAALGGCGSSSPRTTTGATVSSSPSTAQNPPSAAQTQATATAAPTADVLSASAGTVTATMHGSTHEPRVGPLWPDSFIVTSAGRPVRASLEYEFLLAGQVVARRSHYTFTGHFHDTIEWPAPAVGYPLTLRSVIRAAGVTLNLDYPVKVRR